MQVKTGGLKKKEASHVRCSSRTSRASHPSAQHHDAPLARQRLWPHAEHIPKDAILVQVSTFLRSSPSVCPLPFSTSYWFAIVVRAAPLISLLSQPLLASTEQSHQVQGCKADLGKESPLCLHLQECRTWPPRTQTKNSFQLPRKVRASSGSCCVHFWKEPLLNQPSLNLLSSNSFPSQPGP